MRHSLRCHATTCTPLDPFRRPALACGLVARAAARGVDVLALTDHDEVSGLAEARAAAAAEGIALVAGAELSVSWEGTTVHVVALQIDPGNVDTRSAGLESIRGGRKTRARRIADALAEAGIRGAYEGALRYVTSERLISRTHFARYLVDAGHARDVKEVFNRFLVRGKPGYVPHAWASLSDAAAGSRAPAARQCSPTPVDTGCGKRDAAAARRIPRCRRRSHRGAVAVA